MLNEFICIFQPVGYPILCNEMVQLLYTVWERTERSCVPLAPVLLEGSNNDVRQTCLQCIKKQVDSGRLYLQGLLALQVNYDFCSKLQI